MNPRLLFSGKAVFTGVGYTRAPEKAAMHDAVRFRPLAAIAAALLGCGSLVLPARAGDAAGSAAPAPISHGIALTPAKVGPAARGLTPTRQFPGGEIRDGRAYPFARSVPTGASYDGYLVAGPHLLIERVRFTSPVDIYTRLPVVLRGVALRPEQAAHWALHTRPGAGPVTVLWSEIGAASIAGAPADRRNHLERGLYLRSDRVVVYRSHIMQAADGIQVHSLGTQVVETLIDRLTFWQGDHNDGVQMLGRGADLLVLRCRIVNANPQTSALNLIGDRVRVEASYLAGGGWTVYAGSHVKGGGRPLTRDVVFIGNLFGREPFPMGGSFGAVTAWDASPGTGSRWTDNRFVDGHPVPVGD